MRANHQPDLDASLEAYAAATEAAVPPRNWSARLGNWPVYAAATGAALASGTSAAASIIHGFANIGLTGLTISVPATGTASTNSDSFQNSIGNSAIGYWAPRMYAFHFLSTSSGSIRRGAVALESCACSGLGFAVDIPTAPGPFMLQRFNSGEVISGGPTSNPFLFAPYGVAAAKCAGTTSSACGPSSSVASAQWGPSNAYGFVGFRTAGTTTGPTTNPTFKARYGWIRLKWTSSAGFPASITALDWAIEDSYNVPIIAGDVGPAAVPEPGTLSMGLLAAGAAGIVAWRKRRAAAAKA